MAVDPDLIATADPGRLLRIRRGIERPIPIMRPVQVVDASSRDIGPRAC